ncbi:hypothetical protein [Methylorubrum sp. SB2]|uniref:hypothetical protein n=1 Tax=Methylorubrum subtropicum TaxID=3138812 RepID=UPI00313D5307
MRRFVVDLLDFLCLALIVLATVLCFLGGAFGPNGNVVLGMLAAMAAFITTSVAMGAILAITEIAKNSRRMVALMEQSVPPRR